LYIQDTTVKPKVKYSATPTDNKPARRSLFDQLPDSAFIREAQLVPSPKRPDVAAPLPFSAPTLWRKVAAGDFPKPIKLSERVTVWKVSEVRAWMEAQAAEPYEPMEQPRKLTKMAAA
jgi:predicted DNA-binding transcriptional regulator AlpA